MSETGKHLVLYQKNAVAVVGRQLDITERLLKERTLALMVDEFNVPADGTFEEAVQRVRPDGLITIDAGRYVLEAGVVITKPLRIMGAGRDLTFISSSVRGTITSVVTDGLFVMENVGIFRTDEHPGDLLSISAREVIVKSCAFVGNRVKGEKDERWSGIRIVGSTVGLVDDTSVTCCQDGIIVEGNAEIVLQRNHCEVNMGTGILFSDSSTGTANNNICRLNKSCGICVHQTMANLNGNLCEENEGFGILFGDSATGRAENNICCQNELHGIKVMEQSEVNLFGNSCEENRSHGIFYSQSASGTAENNICSRNNRSGIRVICRSEVNLIGNRCEENVDSGIMFGESAIGTAKNNISSRNKQHGILAHDQLKVNLSGNRCNENGLTGIVYRENISGTAENNQCV